MDQPVAETSICPLLNIHKWQTSCFQLDTHILDLGDTDTARDKYVSENRCVFQDQENISNLDLREEERLLSLTVT